MAVVPAVEPWGPRRVRRRDNSRAASVGVHRPAPLERLAGGTYNAVTRVAFEDAWKAVAPRLFAAQERL
ncbi:hypothetical protein [Streptomyces sp. NPDC005752]|uniref:hypothetical protein n=1 Tax=Streptomyces sp. NPDC005752 TaxID=3157065 RepID=UPI0033C51806